MKYIVFLIFLISILNCTIAQPTINSATVTRIEGGYAVVEYQISGTSITGAGVQWDTTAISDTSNQWKTKHVSPAAGTYKDTIINADTVRDNTEGKYHCRVYAYNGDGIVFSDNEAFYAQEYMEPDIVTNFTTSSVDSSSITVSWSSVTTYAYIFLHTTGSTEPSVELLDTTSPAPLWRVGQTYDPAEELEHLANTVTSWTLSNANNNTAYAFKIYPYNNVSPMATDQNYRQDPNAWLTATTLKGKPTTQASNVSYSNVTDTTFTVSWTNGNGDARVAYLHCKNSFTAPTDDVVPTANTAWSNSGQQCIYVGTGNSVNVTNLTDTATYYVKVYEYNNPGTKEYYSEKTGTNNPDSLRATTAYWVGDTDGTWATNSNWYRKEAPVSSQNIIIPGGASNYPAIAGATTVNDVTIEAGGVLSVNNNITLTVSGDITIESDGSNYGALVHVRNGSTSVSGTSKYNRYIGDQDWHLISNPTSSSSITVLTGYYADEWDESEPDWSPLTSSSSLNTMQGYSVSNSYDDGSYETLSFTGSFNDGSKSITAYNSDTGDDTHTWGWNLVGNPYPSSIDWQASSGWSRSDFEATMYVFDGSYRATHSSTGGYSQYLAPGQGFFVYCTSASGTLGVTNEVRVSNEGTFHKKNSSEENSKINLKLQNAMHEDVLYMAFMDGANDAYEYYDGYKLLASNNSIPFLYTVIGDDILAIDARDYDNFVDMSTPTKIDLGIKTGVSGQVTISSFDHVNIPEDMDVIIADNYNHDSVSIKENPYTFYCPAGTHNDMLDLLFVKKTGNNGLSDINDYSVNAYIANNKLVINQSSPIDDARVIVSDIMGRVIINKTLTTENQIHFPIPTKTNIFVVKIFTDRTILYQKTLVNRD